MEKLITRWGLLAERWASEYDPERKEALYRDAIQAAADCILAELAYRLEGRPVLARLPKDWKHAAAEHARKSLRFQTPGQS